MTQSNWAEGEPLLSDEEVDRIVTSALERGGREGAEVEVTFVGEEFLTQLHEEHLDDATATDVITFDLGDGEGVVGELYVSVDRAREMAEQRGVSVERELALYVVHGVLHLCGHDDVEAASRRQMREVERELLEGFGYPSDDAPHDLEE
jgi:probable rRNA maturation factor